MPSATLNSNDFQDLLARQQDQFGVLIRSQLDAMASEPAPNPNDLWRNFNAAYQLGKLHVGEHAERRIHHVAQN